MENINTAEYWEKRFKSGSWGKNGDLQTIAYAEANVRYMPLSSEYAGSILDYGCALGSAINVYKRSFPEAKIYGIDISKTAVLHCKNKYGDVAGFICGDYKDIGKMDIIISSHVMEHLENDKEVVRNLLVKCKVLYVFVPYKENPLFYEHVNYYEENYYDEFDVKMKNVFCVKYKYIRPVKMIIKNFFALRFGLYENISKDIIMFEFKGGFV